MQNYIKHKILYITLIIISFIVFLGSILFLPSPTREVMGGIFFFTWTFSFVLALRYERLGK